ncbi:hypothetical protein D9M68_18150 [compost metagenome]
MNCCKRFFDRHSERREVYELIVRQSADLLNMIDRRTSHRRAAVDQLDVRVLERDLRINILKFNSSVMRAGILDKFLHGEEMREQMRVIERCQHRILTFTLVNHCT